MVVSALVLVLPRCRRRLPRMPARRQATATTATPAAAPAAMVVAVAPPVPACFRRVAAVVTLALVSAGPTAGAMPPSADPPPAAGRARVEAVFIATRVAPGMGPTVGPGAALAVAMAMAGVAVVVAVAVVVVVVVVGIPTYHSHLARLVSNTPHSDPACVERLPYSVIKVHAISIINGILCTRLSRQRCLHSTCRRQQGPRAPRAGPRHVR